VSLGADLLLVARRLRSSPGYTSTVTFILALVLGANAAMFSAVNATLLQPVAARELDRLVVSWASDPTKNAPVVELSYRDFEAWTRASRSFEQAATFASSAWPVVLRGDDGSERISSAAVSASFFDTLGTQPIIGRGFRSADDVPNAERVVVLSHRLWMRRFGGDPAIVGTPIPLDRPHVVVGVMPEGLIFLSTSMCGPL
jgi:putative ABC transport system permease protein